jgi:hypothetical protein
MKNIRNKTVKMDEETKKQRPAGRKGKAKPQNAINSRKVRYLQGWSGLFAVAQPPD